MPSETPRERQRQQERQAPRPGGGRPSSESGGLEPSAGEEARRAGSGGGGAGGGGGGVRWKPIVAIALAAALALGTGFAFMGGGGAKDSVSQAEVQQRTAAYQALLATPGLPLAFVKAEEVEQAVASLPPSVTLAQRAELREQVDQGRVRLAWVTLWDSHAEDGDTLRFESASSFPIEIVAMNAKTTFAIPYPADGKVLVTGVHDGGGGITVVLESGATRIAWPTMQPGDRLTLPVTPGP